MLISGMVLFESVPYSTPGGEIQNDVLAADSSYATYFGGSNQEDATKVGFDNEGNTVLIGQTQSFDLPITEGALQTEYAGGDWDGFVAKYHENGTLLWATYLGGNGYEHVTNINIDSSNNIILTGCTGSTDFHVTSDAYQSTFAGYLDGFIVKLTPSGELLYGSYFGGTGEDWAYGVHLDDQENIIFGGWSNSGGLATSGAYKTAPQGNDVFVARMRADGQSIQMFTYLGGTGDDRGWTIGVDSDYNIMISGMTTSTNLPCTEGALQDEYGGDTDSYLAIVANDGSSMLYLTYIGGDGEDIGAGSDVDSEGNYLHAGFTESDNLDTVNAFQPEYGGGTADSYLLKLSPDFEVSYFTYLGGNETDWCWDARVTPDDTVVLVGRTNSENYPTLNARYLELSNNYDAFASEFSADGQQLLRSGLFGGLLEDIGEGIAIDHEGSVVITGRAASSVLPLSNAHQEEYGGSRDVFVCHTIFDIPDGTTTTETTTNTNTNVSSNIPSELFLYMGVAVAAVIIVIILVSKRR
jgi:hypothetical protein